ncbi:hypothetical protein J2125_004970 [Erwinia toletana]|uniref:Uncharacterized protein n=1 Tax=Winslowiella toletana TaxID=92490 RepID=A0ABS4PG97_9GAMM|nr:hypothetical protein [Winslowiella toletana]MBP2171674.1 hypothetical protein [Winslowiella toletana]
MELTAANITLLGISGSLLGVLLTSLINWLIARDARSKSFHEWKREKLLVMINGFFEQFRMDSITGRESVYDSDPAIAFDAAYKSYSVSDTKALQLCLFMKKKDSKVFMEKYEKFKKAAASDIQDNYMIMLKGDPYEYFDKREDHEELTEIILFLSSIIEKMK